MQANGFLKKWETSKPLQMLVVVAMGMTVPKLVLRIAGITELLGALGLTGHGREHKRKAAMDRYVEGV